MGKRGPKKTPTGALKLRSSWRVNGRKAEPQPDGKAIKPTWLKGIARKKWCEIVPQLEAMGVLTQIDSTTLSRYCHLFAQWFEIKKFIDGKGFAFDSESVTTITRDVDDNIIEKKVVRSMRTYPQVNLYMKLGRELSRLEADFGMTPASRTAIKAMQPQGQSKAKKFFA